MKRQHSLKAKITFLVALPLSFFVILASFTLHEKFSIMREAARLSEDLALLETSSQLVHETQKERGLTSGFLNGSAPISELEAQRKITDAKLNEVKKSAEHSELTAAQRTELDKTLKEYANLRNEVSSRSLAAPDAVARYTKIIAELLGNYTTLANLTNIAEIQSRIRSAAALEVSKESAGRLRAVLFGVLSKNEPLSSEAVSSLLGLKARVEATLESPAMVMSTRELDGIANFKTSPEWQTVNQIFLETITKSSVGRYNQNPKAYFDTMTLAINRLAEVVNIHFEDTHEIVEEHRASAQKALILMSITMLAVGILLLGLSTWQIRAISRSLEDVISKLVDGSNQVASAAQEIAASGTELSQSVTEQSAAIQETAASVDEIHAMVEKNRDASARSKDTSSSSTRTSQSGKQSVDKMIEAISEISKSNDEIAHQMEEGNREIEEIVKVIAEIGNKTKVINDIVFQTKLLSFNASVEAARAGEHGKGFAVVAEEVGNLAQMSGNASKEISAMLESSINKVEQIVQNTRTRMGDLVTLSKDKVEQGNAVASECGKVLDQILSDVSSVDALVSEIAIASREQAQGISEVTKAMGQLDQATQQNSAVAQQSASAGEALSAQSNQLNSIVGELRQLVWGGVMVDSGAAPVVEKKHKNVVVSMPRPKSKVVPAPSVKKVANGVPAHEDPHFEDI